MDLRHLLGIIRTWLPLLILTAALAGAAGFIGSILQPSVFQAKATLLVGESLSSTNPNVTQLQVSQTLATTYTAIAKTRPILERVSEEIGGVVTPEELAKHIEVLAAPDVPLVTITVEDTDAQRAADTANALATQLIESSPTVQGREEAFIESIDAALADIQATIESTQRRVDDLTALQERTDAQNAELQVLEDRIVRLREVFAITLGYSSADATNRLSVVESATPPTETVGPRVLLNTLLAIGIGIAAILVLAFVMEQVDDTIKDADTVQAVTGHSTLGTIAQLKGQRGRGEIYRLVGLLYPRSSFAEAYRALRSNVEFASVDAPVHSLLVTSSVANEGKTITACNLAVVFAQGGRRVILVDADMRRPGVHTVFDVPNTAGLTTLLRDPSAALAPLTQPTQEPNLRVLTTGPLPPNPTELLGSQRMRALLATLADEADLLVFDSPPMQSLSDAAVLSTLVDGTLVVVSAGHSRRRNLQLTMETLRRAGANVLGIVLNRVSAKAELGYPGYYPANADDMPGDPAAAGATTSTPGATS